MARIAHAAIYFAAASFSTNAHAGDCDLASVKSAVARLHGDFAKRLGPKERPRGTKLSFAVAGGSAFGPSSPPAALPSRWATTGSSSA